MRPRPPRERNARSLAFAILCAWATLKSAAALTVSSASAQAPVYTPPAVFVPPPAPGMPSPDLDLVIDGKRYEASFLGIEGYMSDLERADPSRHMRLLPVFEELRTRRRRTVLAGLGMLVGGAGVAVAGGLTISSEWSGPALYGGILVGAVGLAVMQVPLVSKHKYAKRFMEEHNRLLPDHPLKLEFAVFEHGALATLTLGRR